MEQVVLRGLTPEVFRHPLEDRALNGLDRLRLKGLEVLTKKVSEYLSEHPARIELLGSAVRVGHRQMPWLNQIVEECCQVLSMKPVEVYVVGRKDLNAMVIGLQDPMVVLHAGLVEELTHQELRFVIGHELGHVLGGHTQWLQVAQFTLQGAQLFLPRVLTPALQAALAEWSRSAEFTADRAGLLASQDLNACLGALAKLTAGGGSLGSQVNLDALLQQAALLAEFPEGLLHKAIRGANSLYLSHPWTVYRMAELHKWSDRELRQIVGYYRRQGGGTASGNSI